MRRAIINPPSDSQESPKLLPNEHISLLVELLRPGGAELSRRLVASLLLVPEQDRAPLVTEIERRIVSTYADEEPIVEMHVVSPPVQREGYIEQVHTTYAVARTKQPVKKDGEGTTMAS